MKRDRSNRLAIDRDPSTVQLLARLESIEETLVNGELTHAAALLRSVIREALHSRDAGVMSVATKIASNRAAAKAVSAFHRAIRQRAAQGLRRRSDPKSAGRGDMNDEAASAVIESVLLAMLPKHLDDSIAPLMGMLTARASIGPYRNRRWGDLPTSVRNVIACDVRAFVRKGRDEPAYNRTTPLALTPRGAEGAFICASAIEHRALSA